MSRPMSLWPDDMVMELKAAVQYLQPVADAAKRVVKNPSPRNLTTLKRKLDDYEKNANKVEEEGLSYP